MNKQLSDKELLVRIDERQKEMCKDLDEIKQSLKTRVVNDDNYQSLTKKVNTLWDDRNKVLGVMLGAGLAGGATSVVLQNIVKAILASF